VIWIAQVVLATVFASAGGLKLTQPREKLVSLGQGWAEENVALAALAVFVAAMRFGPHSL
jgi:hypothetical protein